MPNIIDHLVAQTYLGVVFDSLFIQNKIFA